MDRLYVIGAGPGDPACLTQVAKDAMDSSQRILSMERISNLDPRIKATDLSGLYAELQDSRQGTTAVLLSGDTGYFSLAQRLLNDFTGVYEILFIPGISSLQYFSAKIKIPYDDALFVSLHGRQSKLIGKIAFNDKVFIIPGGDHTPTAICKVLTQRGLGFVDVCVGENLSYEDERIIAGKADKMQDMEFGNFSLMCVQNPTPQNPHRPLKDGDFIRGEFPMTKEEVRWIALRKLEINPSDVIYDIGAGTGSVGVEAAREAFDGLVYSFEVEPEACTLTWDNANLHGAFNLQVIPGLAPETFEGVMTPDKAFIGGSKGNLDQILAALVELNPKIRVVATAISLETLHELIESMEAHGFMNPEVVCINAARASKRGKHHLMLAENPVYIICGTRMGIRVR